MDTLGQRLEELDGALARLARQLLRRCRKLTVEINAIEIELARVGPLAGPVFVAVPGCGVFSAAMILRETAGTHRFDPRTPMPALSDTARSLSGSTSARSTLTGGSTAA